MMKKNHESANANKKHYDEKKGLKNDDYVSDNFLFPSFNENKKT